MKLSIWVFLSLVLIITISFKSPEVYIVDNFDTPLEDEWKGRHKNYKETYTIKSEKEETFLSATSTNATNFIIKKISVDITEYPYLNWGWRTHTLPIDGDESVKSRCDVAASIAIVLNKSRFLPRSIKYSWSTTLPEDTFTKSPFAKWPARCDIHVISSGDRNLGAWQKEKVNILEDYKRFYRKEHVKSKKVHAFVIMTDSDNTGSHAQADYDNIYFSKE